MNILDIQDDYGTKINLNDEYVHTINSTTIQVEKRLLKKHKDNNLHILIREQPKLVDSSLKPEDQMLDLPIELIECLLLGLAVKAHNMGVLTNDPRTGSSYVTNPYIDRYEQAIKKAIDYGYIPAQTLERKDFCRKALV